MKKNILAMAIVVFLIFQYGKIYQSSNELEDSKSIYGQLMASKSLEADFLNKFANPHSFAVQKIYQDPALNELYARYVLQNKKSLSQSQIENIRELYEALLAKKPSWPYYYSGLSQTGFADKTQDLKSIHKAFGYGKHENKVLKSLAEVLFYHWNDYAQEEKIKMLMELSSQNFNMINALIGISSKHARLFEFCDFLYEINKVKYNSCKANYWQPLL